MSIAMHLDVTAEQITPSRFMIVPPAAEDTDSTRWYVPAWRLEAELAPDLLITDPLRKLSVLTPLPIVMNPTPVAFEIKSPDQFHVMLLILAKT